MKRTALACGLVLSSAIAPFLNGCAFRVGGGPRYPTWRLTIESNPVGANISGEALKRDGTLEVQAIGKTPKSVMWVQASEEEKIRIEYEGKIVLVTPIVGEGRIVVDFTRDPPQVAGARLREP